MLVVAGVEEQRDEWRTLLEQQRCHVTACRDVDAASAVCAKVWRAYDGIIVDAATFAAEGAALAEKLGKTAGGYGAPVLRAASTQDVTAAVEAIVNRAVADAS